MTPLLLFAGLVALIAGGEALVRGASRLARLLGIPTLVVGLTVVAFGTGAPELAVTIQSVYDGKSDLVLGNVVGSNIANVLLVLGISALTAPLVVSRRLVWLDVPLMIGVSFLMWILALDGVISKIDGILLFALFVAHLLFILREAAQNKEDVVVLRKVNGSGASTSPWAAPAQNALWVVAGLALIVLGARWFVSGAVATAQALGMSQLVIGLTIVAVGTSLPEMVTSVVAGVRGERDIAVGNAVGSNMFNILSVLALTAIVSPNGVAVSSAVLNFDIPVMIVVAIACLPIFYSEHRISRWEGGVFFGYYLAYTVYLILQATEHDAIPVFSRAMGWFVFPLTFLTFLILLHRILRQRRKEPREHP